MCVCVVRCVAIGVLCVCVYVGVCLRDLCSHAFNNNSNNNDIYCHDYCYFKLKPCVYALWLLQLTIGQDGLESL